MSPIRFAFVLVSLSAAGCAPSPTPGTDAAAPADLAVPATDLRVAPDLAAPVDLQGPPDLAGGADACVPNMGPGCCYPACKPGESLVCLGDNICGYPCSCEPGPPNVTATVENVQAWQNCMPIIPPDPLALTADVVFTNVAKADSPPLQLGGGAALDAADKPIATFALAPVADFVVPGGGTRTVRVMKRMSSLAPANACQTIPCNSTVKWRIEWGPKAAPTVYGAVSKAGAMQCVY